MLTGRRIFYPFGLIKKSTSYCRDETDRITHTGGPDFVTESWDPGQFGPRIPNLNCLFNCSFSSSNRHSCQISRDVIFQKSPGLVWKLFPHPVGVFCTLLEPPNCHIMQKSYFSGFSVFSLIPYISLIFPFKGTPYCAKYWEANVRVA